VATPNAPDIDESRIVVVDDNLPSAELVKALLARAGMPSVELINAPQQLLDRYEQLSPHLIVLDLHMPGIDGYTVLGELRRRATPADLPILVLTADTTRDATHRALALGASDFLTKPLDAIELTLRVRNLLVARAAHEGLLKRQRWLEASAELAGELLSGQCTDPLHRLCELALAVADADCALIIEPADVEQKANTTSAGALSQDDADELALALHGPALQTDTPAVLDSPPGFGAEHGLWTGPLLVAPLGAGHRHFGALVLGRTPGRPAFSEAERVVAGGFAHQAALGVELAEARLDQERMLVLDDRHRIARDLHDHVIQRLFATGLRLQKVSEDFEAGPVAEQIKEHLEVLDDTIDEIRSTVFGLRQSPVNVPALLVDQLSELGHDLAATLGFEPQVAVDVTADDAVDVEIADNIMAAAREALTNVARYAHARHVEVSLRATEREVVLEVVDDGVGLEDAHRHSGLADLTDSGHRHGGTWRVSGTATGGTRLVWRAPSAGVQPAGV